MTGRGPGVTTRSSDVTSDQYPLSLRSHMTADTNLHQQKSPLCYDHGLPATAIQYPRPLTSLRAI